MKKIISILLAVLCMTAMFCSCNGKPDDTATTTSPVADKDAVYTSGDFNYVLLEDGTAKIVAYNKKEAPVDLKIPSNFDGVKVTVIGKNTFTSEQEIINVELSRHIREIEPYAFNKSSIKGIKYLSSKVETVKTNTFVECENLTQIVFCDTIKTVEDSAIYLGRMPRIIHFKVDPVSISPKAIDTGKSYENLEIKHYGDISNFKNLETYANMFDIGLILVDETNQ